MTDHTFHPESRTAQGLGWVDDATRAISPPIHVSSTYLRDPDNGYSSGRIYMRADNPAFDQAEALITELEHGHQTMLFASGMAAATAVFQALQPGDHVLAPKVMYWSLRNWLAGFASSWGLDVELIDMTDPAAVRSAIRPGATKLVWVETPANPLWTITDIASTAEIVHAAGALIAVDSTSATPVLSQPLDLGADLVMHSATKYLNGHSDLTAGTVTTRTDNEHWQRLRSVRAQIGGTLGSMESWLLLRGMRTLFLRVRTASASAQQIAEHFHGHDWSPRCSIRGCRRATATTSRRARCRVDSAGCCPSVSRAGAGRDRGGREHEAVEARHLARRRRKPHRASRVDRGRGDAGTAGPAPALGRHRARRRPDRRSRAGAGRLAVLDFLDQATACRALTADRDHLLTAIAADTPPVIHHNPLGDEPMSITDLVIHVSMWDEIVLAVLTEARAGREHWSLDPRWETRDSGRALNVGGVDAGRHLPAELVHHRFRSVRDALIASIAAVDPDAWHRELPFRHPGTEPQTLAGLCLRNNLPEADPTRSKVYQHATVHLGLPGIE